MTDENSGPALSEIIQPSPQTGPPASPPPRFILYRIFVGPRGIRAGWKDVIFILLFLLLTICLRPLRSHHAPFNPELPRPVGRELFGEFTLALRVLIPTAIMAKWIDRKPWGCFGMPLRNAFRLNFWIGAVIGLGALALQLELMHLGGWFDFGSIEEHGLAMIEYGAVLALLFFLTGVAEEALLRGYMQRVTTDGLSGLREGWNFWVSAIIFSLLFGALHLSNPGENKFGIFMVFITGMNMCFSLWRTGDLWFAIGNHAAWDWGLSFLFGTPDSGELFQHRLMHSSLHGPLLLSGGTDGPEGSVLVLLSEALIFVLVAAIYRRKKFPLITDVGRQS